MNREELISKKLSEDYWINKLSNLNQPPLLTDSDTKITGTLEYCVDIPAEIGAKMNTLFTGEKSDANKFLLYLSVLKVLYHKYTGCFDIVIGTSDMKLAGLSPHQEQIIFLRTTLNRESTFKDIVKQEQRSLLEAIANYNYDFESFLSRFRVNQPDEETSLFRLGLIYNRLNVCKAPINRFEILVIIDEYLQNGSSPTLTIKYNAGIKQMVIDFFADNYISTLKYLLNSSQSRLKDIDILSGGGRSLLEKYSAPEIICPLPKTAIQLFEEQVQKVPDRVAVVFREIQITYGELNRRATWSADVLRDVYRIRRGDIVTVILERSERMVIATLGILKAGGVFTAVDAALPGERKVYILKDSLCKLLITETHLLDETGEIWGGTVIDFDSIYNVVYEGRELNPSCDISNEDIAFLIYTSGSTGRPKGILQTHRCLTNVVLRQVEHGGFEKEMRVMQFSSISFDVYIAHELFFSLLSAGCLCIVDDTHKGDLIELGQLIARWQIQWLLLPVSLLNLIFEQAEMLREDSTAIKHLVSAGEQLNLRDTLIAYLKKHPHILLHNFYGPSETHNAVNHTLNPAVDQIIVEQPIGRPCINTWIYILSKNLELVPVGAAGEIYISGAGMAKGYINNQELTCGVFISNPFLPGQLMYKTGDKALWLPDGTIRFLGRYDEQVKIRGIRVEPGEIEKQLLQHPKVCEAVAVAVEDIGGTYSLFAYVVPAPMHLPENPFLTITELREYAEQYLPASMVPSGFMILEKFPLNPNGKVNKKALPAPKSVGARSGYTAPTNEMEKKLVEIWSKVLKIDENEIGIDANFFELGGHSLKATIMIYMVHKELNFKLSLAQLFKTPVIRHLAAYMQKTTQDQFESILNVEDKEYYKVSSVQKRLYFIQQINPDNRSYNLPINVILEGDIKKDHLEKVFTILMDRHESLRTSFHLLEEEVVQRISEQIDITLDCYEMPEDAPEVEKTVRRLGQPYDLSQPPLWRVGLIKFTDNRFLLGLNFHHIIFDGVSLGVLVKEFMSIYNGERLTGLKFQYKDFAQWQNSEKQINLIKQQRDYWLNEFSSEIPVLNLPTDFPRPDTLNFEGDHVRFTLNAQKSRALNDIASKEGATLFIILMALINVFLYKMSGQEDIVVGTSAAGRRHDQLYQMIGMFINTLALRNFPRGEQTFLELLQQVKTRTLESFDNQDYQFNDLVESVLGERVSGRNPLFDVMFVLNNEEVEEVCIPRLKLIPYTYEKGTTQLDLKIRAREIQGEIFVSFEYSTQLFRKETMEMYMEYLKQVIDTVIENKTTKLQDFEITDHLLVANTEVFEEEEGDFGF